VELPHRAVARLAALLLALGLVACAALPGAARAADLNRPESLTKPPRFFEHSARQAERIAAHAEKVREAVKDGPLQPDRKSVV